MEQRKKLNNRRPSETFQVKNNYANLLSNVRTNYFDLFCGV